MWFCESELRISFLRETMEKFTKINIEADVIITFLSDPETEAMIMIGEIGGTDEEEASEFLRLEAKKGRKKPTVGFIAGRTAPPGRRMGHAGAIISGGKGGAEDKIEAMKLAGISVSDSPAKLGETMLKLLQK